jgi:hypothetical protein
MKRKWSSLAGLAVFLLLHPLASALADSAPRQAEKTADQKVRAFLNRPERKLPADADALMKLQIERFQAASLRVRLSFLIIGEGLYLNNVGVVEAVKCLMEAELDLAANQKERMALLEGYIEFFKEAERVTREMHLAGSGRVTLVDVIRAKVSRLDVEIRLLKAKREKTAPRGHNEGASHQ